MVLSGAAVCAAEAGESTVTWTSRNDSGGSLHANGARIFVGPENDVEGLASGQDATAVEVIPGPAADTPVDSASVVVEFDDFSDTFELEATVNVLACGSPPPEPATPVDPTVVQATCANGVVTVPTVTPGTTPAGVTYDFDPPGPYDGHRGLTVTVTATLSDGLAWGELPDDWTEESPTAATFTVELVGTTM